jgi:hypothetical protein
MGQSIGSIGNIHKQKGAGDQQKNQPSTRPGQRVSDQDKPVPKKGGPDGGADHGPRSVR